MRGAAAQDIFPFQAPGFQGVVTDQPTEVAAAVGGGVGAGGLEVGKECGQEECGQEECGQWSGAESGAESGTESGTR